MPGIIERIRNVVTDELSDERQLSSICQLGRDEIVAEMTATLATIRNNLQADWMRDGLSPEVRSDDLYARYEGRIELYNQIVHSLYRVGENTSVDPPAPIHPEGLLASVEAARNQQQFDFSPQEIAAPKLAQSAPLERANRLETAHENAMEIGV